MRLATPALPPGMALLMPLLRWQASIAAIILEGIEQTIDRTSHRPCLHHRRRVIAVVVAHPLHLVLQVSLVTAHGRKIEHVVGAHHHLYAASVGRVGMEDFVRIALEEHANAGPFLVGERPRAEVVVELTFGDFFRRKTDAEVVDRYRAMTPTRTAIPFVGGSARCQRAVRARRPPG
jgi:hypothetical protein